MNIYKYVVPVHARLIISCVEVLSAIEQNGEVVVYVLNDEERNKDYFIHVVGTGWEFNPHQQQLKFLDTVKCGSFVWHVFYRKRRVAV